MQAKSNPLFVIINPPGIQYGMPGQTVEINVVVINEGQQSAVINLFFTFDETFEKISNWASSPRASLAIAPGESSNEVTFELEIPVDALPGTYDYTFVVDSPEHYPQDTPINFPGQIKVLLKEQTVIRANDPTFFIQPATNPSKPLVYQPDQLLQVTVKVENRSTRVDRFHLTCPELDEEWLKISYPETGVEATGLVEVSALELNPISEGQILLEFRVPINTLAGNYSPTIRLHSENNPDLILLDLVYIYIPTDYQLNIELNTILGKVSRKLGKYQLRLMNQGNLVRELHFSARSRDEEELCIYQFEPTEVKLLPSKSAEANLTVKPRPWWKRPWRGQPLVINFQVDVQDKQELPIPSKSPQAILEWKARPFWQLLLLIILGFGLVAAAGFLIWRLLYPEPLKIEELTPKNLMLIEGDEVRLNWKIANYKQLKRLIISTKQPPSNEALLDESNIKNLLRNGLCQPSQSQEELICKNFKTGITAKGKYIFEIKASSRQRSLFSPKIEDISKPSEEVEIRQKPIAEIVDFNTDKVKYQKGENVVLSWTINRPELLNRIEIFTKADDNTQEKPRNFKFKDSTFEAPKLKGNCQGQGNKIKCQLPLAARNPGNFSYELKAYSLNINDRPSSKSTENKIEVIAKPFNIVYFKINGSGSEQLNQVLNEGEIAIISWKVEGEDIQIELLPYGEILKNKEAEKKIKVIKNFTEIILKVTDISGTRLTQQKKFVISVKEKQSIPTPNPSTFPVLLPNNKRF